MFKGTAAPASRNITSCGYGARLKAGTTGVFVVQFNFKQLNRHCEPTGRANARPMTGSAKQSIARHKERMDCFVASAFARRRASADKSAPRNDEWRHNFAFSRRIASEVCH